MEQDRLNKLKEHEIPYEGNFWPTIEFIKNFSLEKQTKEEIDKFNEFRASEAIEFIAGRIIQIHLKGGINFIQIERNNHLSQLIVEKKNIKAYELLNKLQNGDIIGASGKYYMTARGVLSIKVEEITLLTKCLQWIGKTLQDSNEIKDRGELLRKRYVDLNINRENRDIFKNRSKIINAIRNNLLSMNFIEVETRTLLPVNSGANAKPFITHHNTFDKNLYLRVAPELDLKRLCIGGLENIFEISKSFRNEGQDKTHNPEFTSLEAYKCYENYRFWIEWAKTIFSELAKEYRNISINFEEYTMVQFIKMYTKVDVDHENIEKIFEEIISNKEIIINHPYLIITQFPDYTSPLAARNLNNKNFCDRFEIYIHGIEIANGYQELTDSILQRELMSKEKEMQYDKDYCNALEYGLPNTAGFGCGMDRILMWLLNAESVKDVICFPF
jgi:lysyl-tRNA synthetase class 2